MGRPVQEMGSRMALSRGEPMTIYGYAGVLTDGQTLDGQTDQLRSAGASKLFSEKESGARSDRPQLRSEERRVGKECSS